MDKKKNRAWWEEGYGTFCGWQSMPLGPPFYHFSVVNVVAKCFDVYQKLARDGVHGIKAPPLDEEDGEHICRWLNCCFSVVNASSNTTSSDPHIVFVRPPMISSKVTWLLWHAMKTVCPPPSSSSYNDDFVPRWGNVNSCCEPGTHTGCFCHHTTNKMYFHTFWKCLRGRILGWALTLWRTELFQKL